MSYKGPYTIINKSKYIGNPTNIVFRSLWELAVMKYCDTNKNVVSWNSEEIVIPYTCLTDGKTHRYFVDFYIKFSNGKSYLIEVKPKKETTQPILKSRKTKKYLSEMLTYSKNISKWNAASEYARRHGSEFYVWTEETLKNLGIMLGR